MRNQLTKAMFGAAMAAVILSGCSKSGDGPDPDPIGGEDGTRWITLTAAFPDEGGTPGNGGTLAYAISPENAADPNYEVRIFDAGKGFSLKSQRTARVQASEDGTYIYNIQYTGADGGVFNKYKVSGEGEFEEVGFELNTAVILGSAPRWTKAAEGIGIGVYAGAATLSYTGDAPNFVYQNRDSDVRIAVIDLDNTGITNTAQFNYPWSEEERAAGYGVGRIDNPVLNKAKTKIFIGSNVSKVDPSATPTIGANGEPSWPSDNENIEGTKTLVLDYPSLRNPKVITSGVATTNNHSYRTMTQYVGTDGHIYQAATGQWVGHQILRISSSTDEYDDSYEFNLNTALGVNNAAIQAWRYIQDGIGIVLYNTGRGTAGSLALIDLNAKTATKLETGLESDEDLGIVYEQYQNIGLHGDYVYVPLTPAGKEGNLYVVDWKNKTITKGAKLANQSGSFFIGAY